MTETVHIAVMDYCSGSIRLYEKKMPNGWQSEDIEMWLADNTGYKNDQCYFMASRNEIPVEREVCDD